MRNVFTCGLSALTPLALLIELAAVLSYTWTGKAGFIIKSTASRVMVIKLRVSRLDGDFIWVPARDVDGTGGGIIWEGKIGSDEWLEMTGEGKNAHIVPDVVVG